MGMFGSSGGAAAAAYSPSQMSGGDKMMMLGAMLKDTVNGYNGQDSNNVMNARGFLAQQQMMRGLIGAMNGGAAQTSSNGSTGGYLSGGPTGPGQSPPTNGQMNPQTLRVLALINPQAARALVEQEKLQGELAVGPNGQVYRKYDPGMVGQNLSSAEYLNGFKVNPNDPTSPTFVPQIPAGAVPNGQGGVAPISGIADTNRVLNAETIRHNQQQEATDRANAATSRINAGTQAAAQANAQSQNIVAPPPGFVVRPRKR